MQRHRPHLLPPSCDRRPSLWSNVKGEKLFISWARSIQPIKRENKARKENSVMLTPAPHPPILPTAHPPGPPCPQRHKAAFKAISMLYFPSIMWLILGLCVQHSSCDSEHSLGLSAPGTDRRCRITWPCYLGKEPKEEELALLLHIQSHSGDYLFLYFLFYLKKNSQCQEEQNVIEIAKNNNNEGGPPGTWAQWGVYAWSGGDDHFTHTAVAGLQPAASASFYHKI